MHQLERKQNGHIEIIGGSMYAGKTEELIRRLKRIQFSKRSFLAFKHCIDRRYEGSETHIVSHAGLAISAIEIQSADELLIHLKKFKEVNGQLPYAVAIDEVQFFDEKMVYLIEYLAQKGVRVIASGLEKDFRREPFGIMAPLLLKAEFVTKLTAICSVCGEPATESQRLVNGVPAKYDDPIVMVGAVESYEPRCRHCHEIDHPHLEAFNL